MKLLEPLRARTRTSTWRCAEGGLDPVDPETAAALRELMQQRR
jgi:hypothetical protein